MEFWDPELGVQSDLGPNLRCSDSRLEVPQPPPIPHLSSDSKSVVKTWHHLYHQLGTLGWEVLRSEPGSAPTHSCEVVTSSMVQVPEALLPELNLSEVFQFE